MAGHTVFFVRGRVDAVLVPCAFAVPHSALPYVEAILPKFERPRMFDEER